MAAWNDCGPGHAANRPRLWPRGCWTLAWCVLCLACASLVGADDATPHPLRQLGRHHRRKKKHQQQEEEPLAAATAAAVPTPAAVVAAAPHDVEFEMHPFNATALDITALRMTPEVCPFIRGNYQCGAAVVAAAGWSSYCMDTSRSGGANRLSPLPCSDGTLRAGTQILLIGNSHVKQIAEAIICENLDTLESFTFLPASLAANSQIVTGRGPPPTVTWTYESSTGRIYDEAGVIQTPPPLPADDLLALRFRNGAAVYIVTNTPLQFTPPGDSESWSPMHLGMVAEYLGFSFDALDAVIANCGNLWSWARTRWGCTDDGQGEGHKPPPPLPHYEHFCPALAARKNRHSKVVDLPALLTRLSAAGFRGLALLAPRFMGDASGPPEVSAEQLAALPFTVEGLAWNKMLEGGRVCAAMTCRPVAGHMCLPGPPDDVAKVALARIYKRW